MAKVKGFAEAVKVLYQPAKVWVGTTRPSWGSEWPQVDSHQESREFGPTTSRN